jgi:hypothetical protein
LLAQPEAKVTTTKTNVTIFMLNPHSRETTKTILEMIKFLQILCKKSELSG